MDLVKTMSAEEYHSHPAISRGDLVLFRRSRRVFKAVKDGFMNVPKQFVPPAKLNGLDIGSATHMWLLEPERFQREVVVWPGRRAGNHWDRYKAWADLNGKLVLNLRQWWLCAVCAAVTQEQLSALMGHGSAMREVPVFWTEQVETSEGIVPVECRSLDDYVMLREGQSAHILDLKTAVDGNFKKSVRRWMYWMQDAHYTRGAMRAFNLEFERVNFAFIVIDKSLCEQVALTLMGRAGDAHSHEVDWGELWKWTAKAVESIAPAACRVVQIPDYQSNPKMISRERSLEIWEDTLADYARCVALDDWSDDFENEVEEIEERYSYGD